MLLPALLLMLPLAAGGQTLAPSASTETREAPGPQIPLIGATDDEIAGRLRGILANIDGLQNVTVRVSNGVVTLEGTTLEGALTARAEDIAERLVGVVAVENRIRTEHRVDRRLSPVLARATNLARGAVELLPVAGVALLSLLAFWFAGRLFARWSALFERMAPNAFLQGFIKSAVRLAFLVVGLLVAADILGATALLGSVMGAAGVLGLAVGFAVRDTIENYIASILLSLRQPFSPGDHILVEGQEGHVTLLNSRATVLITPGGEHVRIPNSRIYKAVITNFTRAPERRFTFEVGIGAAVDIARAQAIALGVLRGMDSVLAQPQPIVTVDRLGGSSLVLNVSGWMNQRRSDHAKVKGEAIRQVKEAFDAAGVPMPDPTYVVRRPDPTPAPEATPPRRVTPEATSADVSAVMSTGADRAIERKVAEMRAGSERDLLASDATKE